MRKVIFVILAIALIFPSGVIAQSDPDGEDTSTVIMLPFIGTPCNYLHYPMRHIVWSVIAREGDRKVAFIDRRGEYREFGINNTPFACLDMTPWCDIVDQCAVVQIIIDDPFTDHCWKSDFALEYNGSRERLGMYHYQDSVCSPDIVRP